MIYREHEAELYLSVVRMIDLNMMKLEMALLHHENDGPVEVRFQLLHGYYRKILFQLQLKSVQDEVYEYRKFEQLVVNLKLHSKINKSRS